MNKTISANRILKNSIFFITLIAITFLILFKDNSIESILKSLKNVNVIYVFLEYYVCFYLYVVKE